MLAVLAGIQLWRASRMFWQEEAGWDESVKVNADCGKEGKKKLHVKKSGGELSAWSCTWNHAGLCGERPSRAPLLKLKHISFIWIEYLFWIIFYGQQESRTPGEWGAPCHVWPTTIKKDKTLMMEVLSCGAAGVECIKGNVQPGVKDVTCSQVFHACPARNSLPGKPGICWRD